MSHSDAMSFALEEQANIACALNKVAKSVRNFDNKVEIIAQLKALHAAGKIESPWKGDVDITTLEEAATKYFGFTIELRERTAKEIDHKQQIATLTTQINSTLKSIHNDDSIKKNMIVTDEFDYDYGKVVDACCDDIEFLKLQLFRCYLAAPSKITSLIQFLDEESGLIKLHEKAYKEHPLSFAAYWNNIAAAELLITRGAVPAKIKMLYMSAIRSKAPEMVTFLHQHGMIFLKKDEDGDPLLGTLKLYYSNKMFETVQLLSGFPYKASDESWIQQEKAFRSNPQMH